MLFLFVDTKIQHIFLTTKYFCINLQKNNNYFLVFAVRIYTFIIYIRARTRTHKQKRNLFQVPFKIIIIFFSRFHILCSQFPRVPSENFYPRVPSDFKYEISPPASFRFHHIARCQPIAPSVSAAPHPESGWATS